MKKKYTLLFLIFLCFAGIGFGQIDENFDGWTGSTSYGNYTYNGFEITTGLRENGANAYGGSGSAVRLRNSGSPSLEYIGSDGNGKDGGVGDISFWYRHWDGSPSLNFDVEVSINGGAYANIGSITGFTSTTYTQFSYSLNNSSDNIKVRVTTNAAERLIIDDILITDYSGATTYSVTYDGNTNTGGSVPIDGNAYNSGDSVTVLGNTGTLVRTGYSFNGWNTASDGSGTSYVGGNTFNITANTTLYAQWLPLEVDWCNLQF
ncbi:MAG TPA: InlB B-repeat-containing protein, partial [Mangrovimonas sp.]|nr:InlB B-repeat-containing protein [Mangrovimonas sp.]